MPSSVEADGSTLIWEEGTFTVVGASPVVTAIPLVVLPSFTVDQQKGRLVHPGLGGFDYEVKPDEWVNLHGDVVIPPIWKSSRTLTGASNVLWAGSIEDVVVMEKWKPLGGLSMPITMLRMLLLMYTNPVDPDAGYLEWWPNYDTSYGYQVVDFDVKCGSEGISLDDVINAKDEFGDPGGWVTGEVIVKMRIVSRVEP